MLKIGNYWLSYAGHNHITIGLPQTVLTANNTGTPIEDRRTDVMDEELAQVLELVMAIFSGR